MFPGPSGFASGARCFSGTKIRVETLFNHLRDGSTIDQLLDVFEGAVNREQAMCAVGIAARELVQHREPRQNLG